MDGVKVWGRRVGVDVQMIADESFSARVDRTPIPPAAWEPIARGPSKSPKDGS